MWTLGLRLSVGLSIVCAVLACSKETPAPEGPHALSNATAEPPPAAAAPPAPAAVAPAPATAEAAAPSHVSADGFELTILPKGSYKATQPGEVSIELVAKPPFHVNDKYPFKFKLKESPGLKFSSMVVGKDAVKVEAKRAVMSVGFTAEQAGKHNVAGQFAFSVCTEDKCMIEKRDLALDLDVD
jgi:hypothetical protein